MQVFFWGGGGVVSEFSKFRVSECLVMRAVCFSWHAEFIKGQLWCLQSAVWQVTRYIYSSAQGFHFATLPTDVRLLHLLFRLH